jgi:tryptophan synthase beta subunit
MELYEAGQIYDLPDDRGHFGAYGGVFVAETLIHALEELKREYLGLATTRGFRPTLRRAQSTTSADRALCITPSACPRIWGALRSG